MRRLAIIAALAFLLGYTVGRADASAPRPASELGASAAPTKGRVEWVQRRTGAPRFQDGVLLRAGDSGQVHVAHPSAERSGAPSLWAVPPVQTPAAAQEQPKRTQDASSSGLKSMRETLTGTASWGYGWPGHVVTRLPRGTPIIVTGPLGAWTGASWGYGPDPDIFPERIADLDVLIFEAICGPRSMGVCAVTVEYDRK